MANRLGCVEQIYNIYVVINTASHRNSNKITSLNSVKDQATHNKHS